MKPTRRASLLLVPLVSLSACAGSDDAATDTVAQAICPPPSVFQHAVCVCDDLAQVGALFAKAGPSGPGSVAVNGRTDLIGYSESSGDWISWQGFKAVGATVGESLITAGDLDSIGDIGVGADAVVGGDLTCIGRVTVAGSLALAGDERVLGVKTIASRATYAAPAGPPCNCDPSTFFDVEGAIAAAKAAAGGASSWSHIGLSEIRLSGGNYYVTAADVIGKTTIHIDGDASVFVDGSLRQIGAEQWKLAPGVTLDLFVGGDVLSVGQLIAGNPADPTAFRLYLGGSGQTKVGAIGDTRFHGSIYAPRSVVAYIGNAEIRGAIFAKTIAGVGRLVLEYGTQTTPPTSCDPQPPGGGGGADDEPIVF